jgi:uncharacterized membrane protein YfcA
LQKRVHLKIGLLIAAGGLPGSILGAIASVHISARLFDAILAVLLVAVAVDMAWNAERRMAGRIEHDRVTKIKGHVVSRRARSGVRRGSFSSLFGLGGGIVLVPAFLYFSELPAHAISATSHFAILLTSPVGLVVHALQHDIVARDVVPLVAGGIAGRPDRRAALAAAQIAAAPDRRGDRVGGRRGFAYLAPTLEPAL